MQGTVLKHARCATQPRRAWVLTVVVDGERGSGMAPLRLIRVQHGTAALLHVLAQQADMGDAEGTSFDVTRTLARD